MKSHIISASEKSGDPLNVYFGYYFSFFIFIFHFFLNYFSKHSIYYYFHCIYESTSVFSSSRHYHLFKYFVVNWNFFQKTMNSLSTLISRYSATSSAYINVILLRLISTFNKTSSNLDHVNLDFPLNQLIFGIFLTLQNFSSPLILVCHFSPD